MDMNTNLFGVNPAVRKVLSRIEGGEMTQYPDSTASLLRKEVSKLFGLKPGNILVANGTNEIFDLTMKAFVNPGDPVVVPRPTFSMYSFYATIAGGKVVEIPLTESFELPRDFLRVKSKITIIPSPSNPTGNCFSRSILMDIIEQSNIVMIDEIYADYCGQNFMKEIKRHSNLIVTRTFSKAYGLAGMRIGYCAADEKIIDVLERVKPPYSVNTVAQMVAVEAIRNRRFVKKVAKETGKERKHLLSSLQELGFAAVKPDANFIFAKCPVESAKLVGFLMKDCIYIKNFGHLAKDYVRITVGTREMNDELLRSIGEFLSRTGSIK